MKIEMSAAELVKFVTDGQFPESAKTALAGGILSMCNSPEMEKAITSKFEKEIDVIMKDSLFVKPSFSYGYNKKTLQGWAAEILLTDLTDKAKELDIKSIMAEMISKEVRAQIDVILREKIKDLIREEYNSLLQQRVDDYNIQAVVRSNVKQVLSTILSKTE